MINYIIVDDEHIAHDIIKGYCDALPNLSFIQHCYDAIEAMESLRNNNVDLIFLDLNMPKLKGFEFLKALQNPPKVIVTTAYQEHALEGYELNIVDYLLKPFSFERFIKAINKIDVSNTKASVASTLTSKSDERIFVKSSKKMIQINLKDILFVEAIGNYCKIITVDDEIQIREKISDFINVLPTDKFFQVHKSFIISKNHINSIEGNRIFINDFIIPIGKVYKTNLNKIF
ncbi:response regulator transcription factor [Tenacibaculum sp. S7007]|uniref:Response regulator transcription factor n=1 Tax=Tenacibaculum pelagium TaxID=2759527 RepID=A0A839ALP8_9FLAO|nr:LytTR family DNA-binding domain-containing protein [Tenacibaculum pelagium]MBA6155089.1 response regulator transcription factor [Tenacibaculum pelagium]